MYVVLCPVGTLTSSVSFYKKKTEGAIFYNGFSRPTEFFLKKKKNGPGDRSNSSESEEFFDIHRASFALKSPQLEPGKSGFLAYISLQNT